LELLDDRHGVGATLITSQYAPDHWHEIIGDATVADAILDRLTHNAHRIDLKGESLRKPKEKGAIPRQPETTGRVPGTRSKAARVAPLVSTNL